MFRGDFTSNTKLTDGNNNNNNKNNIILRRSNFQRKIGTKLDRLNEVFMVSTTTTGGGGRGREPAEEDMDRLKPLHNFDLPCLKWGNQKVLRCMKVDSNGDVSVVDRNHLPESGGAGAGANKRNSEFEKRFRFRFRSSDGDRNKESFYKFPSSEKVTARIGVAGDVEIEATREKLMFDFQKEVGKMKDAILREGLAADPTCNPPAERPWNLRTRRAPRSPSNGVNNNNNNNNGEVLKPNSSSCSPVVNECKYYPNLRNPNGVVIGTTSGEKRERPKFSVSLTRRELEEDFMAMAGRRLPRKPKKRPRIVQKQLDTLFPGLWLSEITADLYKVPDEAETTGKR